MARDAACGLGFFGESSQAPRAGSERCRTSRLESMKEKPDLHAALGDRQASSLLALS